MSSTAVTQRGVQAPPESKESSPLNSTESRQARLLTTLAGSSDMFKNSRDFEEKILRPWQMGMQADEISTECSIDIFQVTKKLLRDTASQSSIPLPLANQWDNLATLLLNRLTRYLPPALKCLAGEKEQVENIISSGLASEGLMRLWHKAAPPVEKILGEGSLVTSD